MKPAKTFLSDLSDIGAENSYGQPAAAADPAWLSADVDPLMPGSFSSAVVADDYPGNTSTAGVLGIGGSLAGTIETAGDSDWFRITLVAGHSYTFNLKGVDSGQGTLADPFLRLFDANGGQIITDDDSGVGRDSLIAFTAGGTGTYFLAAEAFSGTGSYRLSAAEKPTDTAYDIVVRYSGDPRYQSVFEAAAQRWEQIVTADLPDVANVRYGLVDDLLIDASVSRIDGAGSVLAQAGPDEFRGARGASLPFHGSMQFDSADIEQLFNEGTLLSVVLHEMCHVVGFGTIWDGLNLLNGFAYTGANALAEYRALTGNASLTGIPVEDQGAADSQKSHWRESIFDTELMTSFAEPAGIFTPLSRMTVASLSDLGYQVNLAAADPYSLGTPGGGPSPSPTPTGITSNGFDPAFYLAHNPDVAAAGIDPYQHYLTYGWKEGRDPNAYFSTLGYLNDNRDVKTAGLNPLLHYDAYGWREFRDPGSQFDTEYYLLHNPDVAAAQIDPLAHFLTHGINEARLLLPAVGNQVNATDFDRDFYLLSFADVAAAGVDPYQHFLTNGWREGRDPNGLFHTSEYLARNPDVAAAGINPLLHYAQYGWREGRDPSSLFSTSGYLAANPDVAAAGIDPLNHFIVWGIHEGRLA
jgi:Leishmanolysin/Bacterial pre-peptidase C-terminal domain